MAGTIPISMTQQLDQYGDPLSGGQIYFFVAGTTSTPQNAFKDLSLTLAHPNPITLDMAGRVPQLFFADGLIKLRITDDAGVVQLAADNVQVIGASSGGGGGGGAIDVTTVFQTGDLKKRYGTGVHTGWVRCNSRTIGGSLSSATELADPSAQALFIFLWGVDPNLLVIGGRGSTGLADWNAGKQITLPDGRGTMFAGMDDMGGVAANRLTTSYFGANATVLGARGGFEYHTLTATQQASMSGSASVSVSVSGTTGYTLEDINHSHLFDETGIGAGFGGGGPIASGGPYGPVNNARGTASNTGNMNAHRHTVDSYGGGGGSAVVTGGGQPHANVQPTMVVTFYLKL